MLALAASFIVSIISAISVGSLTVASTLSTIVQVGGLAIVSQGALTRNGQQKVRDFMIRFRISSNLRNDLGVTEECPRVTPSVGGDGARSA